MSETPSAQITRLLGPANQGNEPAAARLVQLVYDQLREIAGKMLHGEAQGHTLQPTAVVHEAYLKLVDQKRVDWKGCTHFKAVAAKIIRRILSDHARRKGALKRGGGQRTIVLDETMAFARSKQLDVIALEEALIALAQHDERECRVVELRFYSNMTEREISAELGVSVRTVQDDWRHAKVWLRRRLEKERTNGHGTV